MMRGCRLHTRQTAKLPRDAWTIVASSCNCGRLGLLCDWARVLLEDPTSMLCPAAAFFRLLETSMAS